VIAGERLEPCCPLHTHRDCFQVPAEIIISDSAGSHMNVSQQPAPLADLLDARTEQVQQARVAAAPEPTRRAIVRS